MLVPLASPPALGHQQALPGCDQVAQQLAAGLVVHDRSRRHRDDQVGGAAAGHVVRTAVRAAVGDVFRLVAVCRQGIERLDDLEDDVAATAAIPTVRPTARYVLLTVEMDHAIPTLAGTNVDDCFIDKHSL
jgi:chaperonin GroEL (HSP60 family)